ncbi:MAG: ATP synthase F1 subunit delta [Acidobacteria bacterium]|nr:ATP synthase F1 subunit delta [Acidobacteriota bacterium]
MTQRTSANRYARALLDVAIAESDPVLIEQQLAGAAEVFTGHADLWRVMTNPSVPAPKKRAIVDALVLKLDLSPVVRKTLQLLATRDRLVLLPDLLDAYRSRLLDHQKVVRAQVTSAVTIPADRVAALGTELATLTGRKVVMTSAINPDLIGGVVTQIGSTVYDGSIKRQLEKMRERLEQAL